MKKWKWVIAVMGLFVGNEVRAQAPANDLLEASEMIEGTEVRFTTSNFGATRESDEPRHARQTGSGLVVLVSARFRTGHLGSVR